MNYRSAKYPICLFGFFVALLGRCDPVRAGSAAAPGSPVGANSINETYSAFLDLDLGFSTWQGTRGSNVFAPERGKGNQFFAPLSLGFSYERANEIRIDTKATTGYASAHHDTVGQQASIDTAVDTQLSTTITFLNPEVFQPFIGLALNMPTGKTYLPGNERFTRMDPDLVGTGTYGMGFNVNPTIGVTFALNNATAMSFGVGYAWMGAFTRETIDLVTGSFDAEQRVKPGDTFTANGTISTALQNLTMAASFAFMAETNLLLDELPAGRKGGRFIANFAAVYVIDPRWSLENNFSWSYLTRDKVVDPAMGSLLDELKNSNSHVLILSTQPNYMITDRLKIGVNYSLLYRTANSYDVVQQQFVPAKIKQSAGLALSYALSEKAKIDLRLAHFWVVQQDGPLLPTVIQNVGFPTQTVLQQALSPPSLHYTGWTGGLATHVSF